MIQLIEAPPRSGKSYFAVNYLCKFTEFDGLYTEYVLDSSVLIISNIEGLKINHWDLAECLKSRTLKEFFCIANFERIMEKTGKTHVILAIDECHDYFPAGFVDHDIYSFFAFHGHIGLDVILMTQSLDRTSRMFNPLLEYIVKVTPRSRAVLNNFSYSFVDLKGRFLYSKSIPKKKLVFGAYKSFRKDEQNKPKNAIKHWLIVVVVFFVVAGFLFKSALAIVKGKGESGKKASEVAQKRLTDPDNTSVPAVGPGTALKAAEVNTPVALPVQKRLSSSFAVPVSNVVTVKGVIAMGDNRGYLLSDGRCVKSNRVYAVGAVFKP